MPFHVRPCRAARWTPAGRERQATSTPSSAPPRELQGRTDPRTCRDADACMRRTSHPAALWNAVARLSNRISTQDRGRRGADGRGIRVPQLMLQRHDDAAAKKYPGLWSYSWMCGGVKLTCSSGYVGPQVKPAGGLYRTPAFIWSLPMLGHLQISR